LIGGKLTTHRQVGEEFVNLVFRKRRQAVPPCPTRKRPLPGAMLLDDPKVEQLTARYGDRIAPAGAGSSSGHLWGPHR
jgi:glycerol-3-phosphate dehydrogenase